MSDQPTDSPVPLPQDAGRRLRRALVLTRSGMVAERALRAYWPLASVVLAVLACLMFGLQDVLPLEAFWTLSVASLGLLGWSLWRGARRFRWPTAAEAMARLDATLPGRPLAAIHDRQAIGAGDAASEAVWQAHLARMAQRLTQARAVEPDLKIASRDPYALRYVALVAFLMAVIFGSFWRVASVAGMAPGGGVAAAQTAAWEGWVEPPAYTGKPALYLADVPAGKVAVPKGSLLTLRLYGEVGKLIVDETVSGRIGMVEGASEPSQSFKIVQDGKVAIRGPGGREWQFAVIPDQAPTIEAAPEATRTVAGEMRQDYSAKDDYGIAHASAEITLDLARVDRRYGLATDPEARQPISIDLPLPVSGSRREFTQTIAEDFSQHPWANLPVTIRLTAEDAARQKGSSPPDDIILPGRRFFDTMAMAIVEMRRDLLWSRQNAARAAQVLRAISYKPDEVFKQPGVYLRLRTVIRRLEAGIADGPLDPALRDDLAKALWDIAVEIEDGTLADALERLRQARDRLSEAIKNGATDAEIAKLTDDLRQAMKDYTDKLAQQAPPAEDQAQNQDMQQITGDQLEQMLQKLQELMEQGRTAEAQALLDQLTQMMENIQVTRGQGQRGAGQQAMKGLSDTLKKQQDLSDDTIGDIQKQYGDQGMPGQQQPGARGGDGQRRGNAQDGDGQQTRPGEGQGGGNDSRSPGQRLAERQNELRGLLDEQRRNLPGAGSESGDAAREALGRAEGAMDQAEKALREDDLSGALDHQAEAMEAMRDGIRNLGDMMAKNQGQQQPGQGQNGESFGQANRNSGRDPLGREQGDFGRIGTDLGMLQGEDVYRRAREILDEIRRRSADRQRSQNELDYLKGLLERF
jgi:uncharacterized protein (TIGR02302 family)